MARLPSRHDAATVPVMPPWARVAHACQMRYRFFEAAEEASMGKVKVLAISAALSLALTGLGMAQLRPMSFVAVNAGGSQMQMDMSGPADQGVPSYHAYALKPPIPATMDPKLFPDRLNRNVYALAAKIKPVLYQQPCYCYCDRNAGHKSLLDCYLSEHGSQCDICQREAVLAYQLTQKGKTPGQIRAAIIHGDWKAVDLRSYTTTAASR
jgi:Protein of unknown function with PCYCGC motif